MNRVVLLVLMLATAGIQGLDVEQSKKKFSDALAAYKSHKTPATIRNLIDSYSVAMSWGKSQAWVKNQLCPSKGGEVCISIPLLKKEVVELTPAAQKEYVEQTERSIGLIEEILAGSDKNVLPIVERIAQDARKVQDRYLSDLDLEAALRELERLRQQALAEATESQRQQDAARQAAENTERYERVTTEEIAKIVNKARTPAEKSEFEAKGKKIQDKYRPAKDLLAALGDLSRLEDELDNLIRNGASQDDADTKLAAEIAAYVAQARQLEAEITASKNTTRSQHDAFLARYDALNDKAYAYSKQSWQSTTHPKSHAAYNDFVGVLKSIEGKLNAIDTTLKAQAAAEAAASQDAALEAEINTKLNVPALSLSKNLPPSATVTSAQLQVFIDEFNDLVKQQPLYSGRVSSTTTPRAFKAFGNFVDTLATIKTKIDALKTAAAENDKRSAADQADNELTTAIDALALQAVALKTELLAVRTPTIAQLDAFEARYKALDSKAGAYAYLASGSNNTPKATKAYGTLRAALDDVRKQLDSAYTALDNAAVAALTSLENDYAAWEKQLATMGALSASAFTAWVDTFNSFVDRQPGVRTLVDNIHNTTLNQQAVIRYNALVAKMKTATASVQAENDRRAAQNDPGNIYDNELKALDPELKAIETRALNITASNYAQLKSDWDTLKAKIAPYAAKISALSTGAGKTAASARYNDMKTRGDAVDQKLAAAQAAIAQAASAADLAKTLGAFEQEVNILDMRTVTTQAQIDKLTADLTTFINKVSPYREPVSKLPDGSPAVVSYNNIYAKVNSIKAKIAAAQAKLPAQDEAAIRARLKATMDLSDPEIMVVDFMNIYQDLFAMTITKANVQTAYEMLLKLKIYQEALAKYDAAIRNNTMPAPNDTQENLKWREYIKFRPAYIKVTATEMQVLQDRIDAVK